MLIKYLMKNDFMHIERCSSYVLILVTKIHQMPLAATPDRVGSVFFGVPCLNYSRVRPPFVSVFAFNESVLWSNAIYTPLLFDLRYRNVSCELKNNSQMEVKRKMTNAKRVITILRKLLAVADSK